MARLSDLVAMPMLDVVCLQLPESMPYDTSRAGSRSSAQG